MADRTAVGRGGCPADHLLPARRDLLAALCQGADDDGQQHLQRLPGGRRLARQVSTKTGNPHKTSGTGRCKWDDILEHCCYAWNKLVDQPRAIMSIGLRDWAHGF